MYMYTIHIDIDIDINIDIDDDMHACTHSPAQPIVHSPYAYT